MELGTFFSQLEIAVMNGESKSIDDILDAVGEKGLSYVDVSSATFDNNYSPESLCELLERHNVNVGSVFHLIHFEYKKENILSEIKENTKICLDRVARSDCGLVMPVPVIYDEHEGAEERELCRNIVAEYLSDFTNQAKEYGITVMLENFSDTRCPFATIEDIDYMLTNVPDLRYALDTGNFWFGGTDVIQAARRFKDKTVHVHLKDIEPTEKGTLTVCGKTCNSVAMGDGIIPFKTIFDIIKEAGYNSGATVEINHNDDLFSKTIKSLDYMGGVV